MYYMKTISHGLREVCATHSANKGLLPTPKNAYKSIRGKRIKTINSARENTISVIITECKWKPEIYKL